MRVWFSKIHCPSFICFFCKPPQHLCTPPASAPAPATPPTSDHFCAAKNEEDDKTEAEIETKKTCGELILKSSIKRKEVEEEGIKKTVKWMDVAGKELVQVKEFEISESEDSDSESEYNRGCTCPIL